MNLTATQQTMLSTEIAILCNKEHKNVLRDIEVIIKQLEDGSILSSGFKSTTYQAGNGKQERCYALDYSATMILVTGYDVVVRAKVIARWQELEKKQTQALSPAQMLLMQAQMLVEMERRQDEVESQVKIIAAKIDKTPAEYFAISGFSGLRGVKIDVYEANMLGRKASKLSKEFGYHIGKTHSELFGEVNTYHIDILEKVFESFSKPYGLKELSA
jgi:phage regulator Rha-like protein